MTLSNQVQNVNFSYVEKLHLHQPFSTTKKEKKEPKEDNQND